jgi:hypothetical protein
MTNFQVDHNIQENIFYVVPSKVMELLLMVSWKVEEHVRQEFFKP